MSAKPGGTILRGADGSMYFISPDKLDSFKLSQATVDKVNEYLDAEVSGQSASVAIPGQEVRRMGLLAGNETTVIINNTKVV